MSKPIQKEMIERVATVCHQDNDLLAAMKYGSFARGAGDRFSDIEFVLFFKDQVTESIDQTAWINQIAPTELIYTNEFGTTVAIFHNLVRGEFHFYSMADVGIVSTWTETDAFPTLDGALIVDKTGALTPHLKKLVSSQPRQELPRERVAFFAHSFYNWLIFGLNLVKRGDAAHAHNILGWVQRYLLSLARVAEDTRTNLPSPSKNLEEELSDEAVQRYRACTSDLELAHLKSAYTASLAWGLELTAALEARYGRFSSERFRQKLVAFSSDLG
jgi:lincosamide nucleotidyltransferase